MKKDEMYIIKLCFLLFDLCYLKDEIAVEFSMLLKDEINTYVDERIH